MSRWPTRRLGDLVDVLSGFAFESERFGDSGDLPIARIRDVVPGQSSTFYRGDYDEKYVVQDGDVLIGMDGEFNRARWLGGRALLNQRVCRIASVSGDLDDAYLFHFLPEALWAIERATPFVTVKHLSVKQIRDIAIPLPPLPEQRRIAEVLDRAEALRAKRRAALVQLDTLALSLFLELFGDPAQNAKGWAVMSLGEIAREKPNNEIFKKNPEYVQDGTGGLPVVWVEELFQGSSIDTNKSRRLLPTIAEVSKYGLKNGDILFCRSSLKLDGIAFNNVYLGQDNAALFECHLIRVQPDLSIVSPIFLNCLLRLPQMRAIAKSKSKTATMTTIDQTALCSIPVVLPPLSIQRNFARRFAAVEKLKTTHRASLGELDAFFASLQHRAFRGEL